MASISKLPALGLLLLLVILAACGGGKGSGVAPNGPVDPSSSYRGVRSKATLTPVNAEALILNSFAGSRLGAVVSGPRTLKAEKRSSQGVDYRIRHLAKVMKRSMRSMELPKLAKERMVQAKAGAGAGGQTRAAKRAVVQQVPGPDGGSASYTLQVNDATGSFYGTVTYNDYISGGIVLSGPADMLGTFDSTFETFSRITLSFRSITARSADGGTREPMVGSLSWASNSAGTSESETINLVVVEGGKTYWWNNYETITSYGASSLTQNVSGRYYDPDYGYIDFATSNPVVAAATASWPSQGEISYNGDSRTGGRLTFLPYSLDIGVDGDGNGELDWHTQKATNEQPPVTPPPADPPPADPPPADPPPADPPPGGGLPVDHPPTVEAGPDQHVMQGALVRLDATGSSDPDGTSLTYFWKFTSCPDNVCPDLPVNGGTNPTFTAERVGTYQVELSVFDGRCISDSVAITSARPVWSNSDLLHMQWRYGLFGSSIGKAGILVRDLDGDGTPEIITSGCPERFGNNTYWYVLRRAPDGSYGQVWTSENYDAALLRLTLVDLTGDGKDDIVATLSNGTVLVYDTSTFQVVKSVQAGAAIRAIAIADLDGDGKKELITTDSVGIFVYSGDGDLKWSTASHGGSDIAVGNVDGDAALEIVTTSYGGKGYVIDGVSREIQWEYWGGFGAQLRLADLDGDGRKEIIGASPWDNITIYDAQGRTARGRISTSLDIDSVLVQDVDRDGFPEIIYSNHQPGTFSAVDGRTLVQKWTMNNPDAGASGIAIADVDKDGIDEIVWGAGGASTGPDYLYIAVPGDGTIKWQSRDVAGPLNSVAVGDLDGDGVEELLMISYLSHNVDDGGVVHVFDPRTHALKFQKPLRGQYPTGVRSVRIGDVDGDGRNEYVVTTANHWGAVIEVYDGITHELKRQSAPFIGSYFSAIAIGDVDGDGKNEIVVGQGRSSTGADGVYLMVLHGNALQEKWRSIDLTYWGEVHDIKLADLDRDGHQEIIASVSGQLMVYDGVNHDRKRLLVHPARALEVADLDNDGAPELMAGREDGGIDIFDGKTFAVKDSLIVGTSPVDALRVATLRREEGPVWLVGLEGRLLVLGEQGRKALWRSEYLGGNLGRGNHVALTDADADGLGDLFLGSNFALYHLERN